MDCLVKRDIKFFIPFIRVTHLRFRYESLLLLEALFFYFSRGVQKQPPFKVRPSRSVAYCFLWPTFQFDCWPVPYFFKFLKKNLCVDYFRQTIKILELYIFYLECDLVL